MATDDRSEGGSVIYHHQADPSGWTPPTEDAVLATAVEQHLAERVGEAISVFHEILSDRVHIDVHLVPPAGERDFWVLFTTGMSGLPMTLPEAFAAQGHPAHAELVLLLPQGWFGETGLHDLRLGSEPHVYWPIGFTKLLARLPHDYKTWLSYGHSIPNGDPAAPLDDSTRCVGAVIVPPLGLLDAPEDWVVHAPDGRTVQLLSPLFVYADELDFKVRHGFDAFADLLDQHQVLPLLQPGRPSVVGGA